MIRPSQVPNGHTAARLQRLRILLTAFLDRQLMRADIADLLQLGPTAVRSYVKDLGDKIKVVRYVDPSPYTKGEPVYGLAVPADDARAYMESMAAAPTSLAARPTKSALCLASQDPARHFHILAGDTHHAIRVSCGPVARDPLAAAFFGAATVVMEVRA